MMIVSPVNGPVLATLSLDEFVKNLGVIESHLNASGQSDCTNDLTLAASWIAYVQRGEADIEQTSHFIRESLPRIIRAVLKKKYIDNDADINAVRVFLSLTANFAASLLPHLVLKESQFLLLTELFDSKQPFYQKYGFTRVSATLSTQAMSSSSGSSNPSIDVEHMQFVNLLDVGSCFDYYHEGVWELAIVERLSEFRTEIEISLSERGVTKWVSVDSGPSVVAPYGTRVGALADIPAVAGSTRANESIFLDLTILDGGEASSTPCPPALTIIEREPWRSAISAGTLVDTKDLQGVWYQACVMEVKLVKVRPGNASPSQAAFTATGTGTWTDAGNVGTEAKPKSSLKTLKLKSTRSVQIEDQSWKDVPDSTVELSDEAFAISLQRETELLYSPPSSVDSDLVLGIPTSFVGSQGTPPSDSAGQVVFENHSVADSSMTARGAVESCGRADNITSSAEIAKNVSLAAITVDLIDSDTSSVVMFKGIDVTPPSSADTSSSSLPIESGGVGLSGGSSELQVLKSVARISYLGWAERYDVWLELDSSNIAPLDSQSQGRRGDNAVREEVIFLVGSGTMSDAPIGAAERPHMFTISRSLKSICFHSPYLADVVNVFGESQGFEVLLNCLSAARGDAESRADASSGGQTATNGYISAPLLLSIITAVGGLHRILSPPFLLHLEYKQLFATASFLLRSMSLMELRETPIEVVEAALTAMEGLAAAMGNHDKDLAQLLYYMAVRYLDCPYLNRRLGGLKMLTDLFKRAQATAAHPSGLNIVRSSFAGQDSVSYRVVPLLPHFTVLSLCKEVAASSFLSSIFRGDRSHESLMLRSGDILRTMLQEGCLDDYVVSAMWEGGLQQRESAAMSTLTDTIAVMEVPSLSFLLHSAVGTVNPTVATVHVVDVLSAIAIRCRALVMTAPPMPDPLSSSEPSQTALVADNGTVDPVEGDIALKLHCQVLQQLWRWAQDSSGVTDQVAVKCLVKLIAAISVGVPMDEACADRTFPWGRHWLRCNALMVCALNALKLNNSVVPAVRLLQAFFCSWPVKANFNSSSVPPLSIAHAPFSVPTRDAVAEYLESTHSIFDTMSACVARFKDLFNASVKGIAGEQPSYAAVAQLPSSSSSSVFSVELQAVLNDVMVDGSRVGYTEQLMSTLDFLHQLLRCSDNLMLGRNVIQSLWTSIADHPVTTEEVNLMVNFLSRLILRNPTAVSSTPPIPVSDTLSCLPCAVQDWSSRPSGPSLLPKRKAVCAVETIEWVFKDLLCDKTFIPSPFFTLQAFNCIEKLFRWLNTEAGFVTEAKAQALSIIGAPSSLIGIGVFSDIIISCKWDPVASQAAAFLTSLPSCLAPPLVQAGELVGLRRLLLQQCTDQLAHAVRCAVDPRALSRLLMLLSGLLEESYQDLGGQVRPHGSLGRGEEVALHVSGANKMKDRSGPLVMYSNDTLGDLFREISRRMDKDFSRLKVFRLAKDITLLDDTKTLGQMKFGLAASEQIMVTERVAIAPPPLTILKPCMTLPPSASKEDLYSSPAMPALLDASTSAATCTAAPGIASLNGAANRAKCSMHVPAMTSSSSSEQLDMLFSVLEGSERALVDEIWGIISRLPSSPSLMTMWLHLGEPSSSSSSATQLLFSLSCSSSTANVTAQCGTVSVSRLLYNLQIVEAFLQPSRYPDAVPSTVPLGGGDSTSSERVQGDSEASAPSRHPLRGCEYLDAQLLTDWRALFLTTGGFEAVCAVYDWLSTFMELSAPSSGISLASRGQLGSSPSMVLQIVEIAVRLMRAILIRATATSLEVGQRDTLLSMLRTLRDTRNISPAVAPISSVTVAPTSAISHVTSFIGPLPPPSAATTSNMLTSSPLSDAVLDAASSEKHVDGVKLDDCLEIEQLLGREWGWAVSRQEYSLLSRCVLSTDMERAQRISLRLMVSLRGFSREEIFQGDPADWTARRGRRRVLFSVLDGLFAVWTAAIVNKPSILLSLTSSGLFEGRTDGGPGSSECHSLELFLTQLLLGVQDDTGPESSGEMGDIFAKWVCEEFQALLSFSSVPRSTAQSTALTPSDHLKSHLFKAILALRPPLLTCSPSSISYPAASASESCVNELFSLALALLRGSSPPPGASLDPSASQGTLLLPAHTRMLISMSLLKELKAASECMRAGDPNQKERVPVPSGMQIHRQHVGGTMRVLHGLLTECPGSAEAKDSHSDILQAFYEDQGVMDFLLVDCLGLVPVTAGSPPLTLCSDDQSRTAAYAILTALCKWHPPLVYEVFRHLQPVYSSVPPLTVWDFKPERDVRSFTGFVGLRNKGCTCYMNSLLQVLYMLPEVREGILSAKISPHVSELAARDDIVLQLQRLFYNLKYSEKKAFLPDDWVYAYKDESGLLPVNVSQQQDAQEFLQVLCERLSVQPTADSGTTTSASTSATSSSDPGDGGRPSPSTSSSVGELLKSSFGGKICNQMLRVDEPGVVSTSSSREQEDPFVCLSLQVKDAKGLEHSLAQFVEGEKIGDYQWDDQGPKVTISKRQFISELSDTLIFHLKRFELNFDTFRREKVNDYFSFPTYLNMLPYTKEGLMAPHTATELQSGKGEGENEGARSSAYYKYELSGVVVHSGTTDSGHYFAYIKDRGDEPCFPNGLGTDKRDRKAYRWLEFNDSEVTEFAESRIEAECFGGVTKSYDFSVSAINEIEIVNPKSAYMLVYRRTRTLCPPAAPPAQSPPDPVPHSLSIPGGERAIVDVDLDVVGLIKRENARHAMVLRLADPAHLACISDLLQLTSRPQHQTDSNPLTVRNGTASSMVELPADILEGLLAMTMDFTAHSSHTGAARGVLDALTGSITASIARHVSQVSLSGSSATPYGGGRAESMVHIDPPHSTGSMMMSYAEMANIAMQILDPEGKGRKILEGAGTEREAEGEEGPTKPSKMARLVGASSAEEIEGTEGHPPLAPDAPQTCPPPSLQAVADSVVKRLARKEGFDEVISQLYCPDQDTRMAFARLLLRVFQLLCWTDSEDKGDELFSVHTEEVFEDLLNKEFSLYFPPLDELKSKPLFEPATSPSSSSSAFSSTEDEEIALAIKLSMQSGFEADVDDGDFDSYHASDIPPVVAVPITTEGESTKLSGKEYRQDKDDNVVEMSYLVPDSHGLEPLVAAAAVSIPATSPLSTGGEAAVSTSMDVDTAVQLPSAVRFLLELTRDSRMQLIAENWRRSDAMTWLLQSIAKLGGDRDDSPACLTQGSHRLFLTKRQLVSQLVAIFTGDVGLVIGTAHPNSRPTAPSSYVGVGPPSSRGGPLPAASKNIPDWMHLLDCVALLVTSCCTESMQGRARDHNSLYPSFYTSNPVPAPSPDAHVLDYASALSATSRTLYSIALKQCRYATQVTSLIVHLSEECVVFSNMVSELLREALFQCSAETTAHIFGIMEVFLTIPDSLLGHRALSMFSGEASPLSMLKGIQDQGPKKRLVCVCIRSLMTLLQRAPSVRDALTVSDSFIHTWAPWMLKFSILFMNECLNESSSAAAIKNSYVTQPISTSEVPPVSAEKGPYVVVYGETEEERDVPWCVRAESTNQLLLSVLVSAGVQPDSILPEDVFIVAFDPPDMPLLIPEEEFYPVRTGGPFSPEGGTGTETGTVSVPPFVGPIPMGPCLDIPKANILPDPLPSGALEVVLADGMTDEQLTEYLNTLRAPSSEGTPRFEF